LRGKIASRRASLSFGAQTALPHAAGGLSRGVEPATGSGAKSVVEAVRLVLAVETDLKPNTGSVARYWLEHGWLDFALIQPGSDAVHGLAEGGSRRFFDTHDEWGIVNNPLLFGHPAPHSTTLD
jgi:hypothetical protein